MDTSRVLPTMSCDEESKVTHLAQTMCYVHVKSTTLQTLKIPRPLQWPRRWETPGMEAVYSKFQHLDLGSRNSMDTWTTSVSFRFSNRELSE